LRPGGPLVDAVNKRQYFGDNLIKLNGDDLVEFEPGKQFDQLFILIYRNSLGAGHFDYAFGEITAPFGDESRSVILVSIVAEGDRSAGEMGFIILFVLITHRCRSIPS